MIEWFARNSVAANLLMMSIVVIGVLSASKAIPVEVFPSFEIEAVTISTALRGATPKSIEDTVTNRIEEAISDLEGIKEINATSSEGLSTVIVQVSAGHEKRELLNDIKLRVDALNTLPIDIENPIVSLSNENPGVLQVAVIGDIDYKILRLTAENIREELLATPNITLINLLGVSDYEVSIEVTPEVLERYNISLADIARAVQQGSVDISAGNIKTFDGDILVRTDGQAYTKTDFINIPVITQLGADPVLLGDIAQITDGFEDQPIKTIFNGSPAVMMDVLRTGQQSSIGIADQVKKYIEGFNLRSTNGIQMNYWDDDSKLIKARLSTLISSGIYGSILVLLILSLFLRPAIAFWVFLGVPVSFMGAFIFMPLVGGTFNMMSLFAFITVLGIVVDDAIVTGENIYRKMRNGLKPIEASIIGTKEIAIPVTFGILTTVVAFLPMANLGANRIGFIAAQVPLVVIPVLLFSLIESKLVLPSHLSHVKTRTGDELNKLARMQIGFARGFENNIIKYYKPFLKRCLHNPIITITALISITSIILAWTLSGHLKFTFFPTVESEEITLSLVMPDTTGFETTQKHIQHIEAQANALQEKYRNKDTGESVIRHTYSTIGSSGSTVKPSVGRVRLELIGPEKRSISVRASDIAREMRLLVGEIAGAEKFSIHSSAARGGEPILIELSGANIDSMRETGLKLRERLQEYSGIFDIQDNFSSGKEELNLVLKPKAYSLGLSLADVAEQVRGSVFGFEAQRIQRGREEVRVMVRLQKVYRSSIEDLKSLPIHIPDNSPIPLSDLAHIVPVSSPTTLQRINRKSILNVSADVDKENVDVPAVLRDLQKFLESEQQRVSDLEFSFKGEAKEQAENNEGFRSGGLLVLIAIYTLLAIPFKSYAQPFIVMSVIPFSMAGAILGHIITGYDLSILSVVGMMALLGVVVNDSLVLVDYINQQRLRGIAVFEAVLESGAARFRPVILTSLTTFAGLTPLLLNKSTQSEFLKQMAISLGFGILFATAITLIIIPVNYLVAYRIKYGTKNACSTLWQRWLIFWNK